MLITEKDEQTGVAIDMLPEDWAALWGSTTTDGVYFYNFGSEIQEHTPEWLTEFLQIINRQIKQIEENLKKPNKDYGWTQNDLDNMGLLYEHVEELLDDL